MLGAMAKQWFIEERPTAAIGAFEWVVVKGPYPIREEADWEKDDLEDAHRDEMEYRVVERGELHFSSGEGGAAPSGASHEEQAERQA
jgi:hypothetical protein